MKRINYRHYICIAITLGFVLCGIFVFPNAFSRLIEGGRDFGLSIAYYFCKLFNIPYHFTPTVNELPKIPYFSFLPERSAISSIFLPETWEAFEANWAVYWKLWASTDNFLGYLALLGSIAKFIVIAMLPLFGLVLLFRRVVKRYVTKKNNDHAKESRPLRAFKRVSYHTYRPVRIWLLGFFTFLREHPLYWKIWLCMWVYFFNGFTVMLEFFAYYFYFVFSFDVGNLYRQVYKLAIDLYVPFSFVPLWVWIIGVVVLLYWLSLRRGYAKLYHHERRNRGFLNERGVFITAFGPPGVGKTAWVTDASLSLEVQILDDALEVILETDMHFPYFPWINLEMQLKQACCFHVCYDVWSVKRWLRKKKQRWEKSPTRERLFGYDYERYGLTYDNKLYVANIWEALEDYALAYFIYTVQSSYMVSNYSIRSDKLINDLGNFPLWDTDFFRRDSRLIDSFSRHAHILDFDMLRLGTIMLKDNPKRNAFGFGVYVISEIDKERKNSPELQGVDRKSNECNQKNDLFNTWAKMCRHGCLVANRVFVHCVADLQRTGSLNADMLELGDTLELREKGEMLPVLPFWSPFWLVELLCNFIIGKHDPFYLQYRNARGDYTLFSYLMHGLAAKLGQYREGIYNLFGCQVVTVRVERGTKDGDFKDCKWYRQSKKWRSKRCMSDCMRAIFEARGAVNEIGLDELDEYVEIMATQGERQMQHSHFQNDIDTASRHD